MEKTRLDKLVSNAFHISRKEAKDRIAGGKVSIDGVVRRDASLCFDTAARVTCEGIEGTYRSHVYIMMNKPEGVVSAATDKTATAALSLLPDDMKRHDLFIAGRLDKNTTGFLLVTNDGAFAHNILSPKKHVPKTYLATLARDLKESDVGMFAEGICLGEEHCKPARLEIVSERVARVTVVEGKFHQIKRMFHAVGNEVVALKREKIGALSLDETLLPGDARYITEEELKMIKQNLFDQDECS